MSINEKIKSVKKLYLKNFNNKKIIQFLYKKYFWDENKAINQLELDNGDKLKII